MEHVAARCELHVPAKPSGNCGEWVGHYARKDGELLTHVSPARGGRVWPPTPP